MGRSSNPTVRLVPRVAAALALALAGVAGAAQAEVLAPTALPPAFEDHVEVGPRTLDLSVGMAPLAAEQAVSGEGRISTELAFGAQIALSQPYYMTLEGNRLLGASRLALSRSIELGPSTMATLDLRSERGAGIVSHGAQTRLEHRFTPLTRAGLALDLGSRDPVHSLSGRFQFEQLF